MISREGLFGIWRIDRFGFLPDLAWLTPVNDVAKVLCRITKDGSIGVSTKELTILPNQGDTLL